ncbi:Aldo/keto reductase [Amylostereum chailletii]|nr:Aldo/keto reductase [Amylostereum chailletii]
MSQVPTRKIGSSDVPAIGYGAMSIAGALYGSAIDGDEERFKTLDAACETGCTHWDTADVYQDSEELIGNWFKRTGKRDQIFLATKCGIQLNSTGFTITGTPEYIKQACDKSLERIGVDCIDLYYLHRPDKNVPIEISIRAMSDLVKEGKVKHIGLSECSESTLRRAHAVHPIAALQVEYSPFWLEIEEKDVGLFDACKELGIAVVAYSPLSRGLLTGRFKGPEDWAEDDIRHGYPRFSKENFPRILDAVEKFKQVGEKHGATPGQVALAWLLAQGDNVIPIPGTRSAKYVHDNAGSMNFKLSAEEVQDIRMYVENSKLPGKRHPDGYEEWGLIDTPPLV